MVITCVPQVLKLVVFKQTPLRLSDSVNSPLVPLKAKTLKYLGFPTVGKPNNVHVDKEVHLF